MVMTYDRFANLSYVMHVGAVNQPLERASVEGTANCPGAPSLVEGEGQLAPTMQCGPHEDRVDEWVCPINIHSCLPEE